MLTSRKNKKPLQSFLGILIAVLSILGSLTSSLAVAQSNTTTPTTIVISDAAKMTNAKRLGINLGTQNFWDSGMIMRNLQFTNPGFEGESWQSILHCKSVTATSCTDDDAYTYWPANFFAGATASFIVGPAAGTTAKVISNTAPNPGVYSITVQLSGLSVAPSVGDYLVVREEIPGNAQAGWWPMGNATYSTDTTDLSPNTPGKQALRVDATGAGQQAVLTNFNDGTPNKNFIQLNGSYTISFRAKSTAGSNALQLSLKRAVTAPPADMFFQRTVNLTNQWQDYSFTYQLSETPRIGAIALSFTLTGGAMLIDDVSFTEAAGPGNPTVYRNAVVDTLQALHPGTIRYMDGGLNWGSSIDNLLAPDFARERAGYNNTNSVEPSIGMGLHDFLVLCKTVGADPWFTMPTGMTTQEMSNLMDYFGGSSSTVYGAKRAALGQQAPWTSVFDQIHLEFGNEVWNTANPGALMTDAASYGKRAGVIFGVAKASPSYKAKSFDFVLDGFEAVPSWTEKALQNSKNYDTVDVATYNFSNLVDTASTEKIFGPMLAEPEWMNSISTGSTAQQAATAASAGPTPANLAVYETNMGTISGSATQSQVNAIVPSLGAGLAVAANMLLAQRDLGVTVQNLFCLEGYTTPFRSTAASSPATVTPMWGVVIDMGGPTNLQRPMFLSEQLANSAILPTLLSTSQSGLNPTWNQAYTPNDNFSLPNAHYIQSMAYTDGKTLNVVLFNMSRTSALPVNFAGVNAPIGTATLTTLTASSITANNEDGEDVALTSSSRSLTGGSTLTLPPFSMTVVSVPAPVVPILVNSVTASCAKTSLSPNGSTTCSAKVSGQGKYDASVVWSAAAGTVSNAGVYTAPSTLPANGKDVITATSVGDATKTGTFTIAIAPDTITGVKASCPATSVNQGAVIKCTAAVSGTGGFSTAYTWSTTVGTIASTGSFTAPSTGTSAVLTATSTEDPTKSATVNLQLTPVLVQSPVSVSVTGTSIILNWTTNMIAWGGASYGPTPGYGSTTPWVNLQSTTHSLIIPGLKPSTTYYLSAFSFVGNQSTSEAITATTSNGTSGISSVSVSCSATSLLLGASTGCAANVLGDGKYSTAVTWSTSLGSVTSTGVVTAPLSLTASTITVTATSVQDRTKSGSISLGLNPPDAITSVAVSCQATTIAADSSTTCSPTVTATGNISKAVVWSASAGKITSAGVVTAPKTGTSSVTVTATSVANPAKHASAVIKVTPLPTITSVTVACAISNLSAGGSTTCTGTLAGTGSYTSAVTWSTSGGTITSAGVITAPASGSSVTVKATSTQDPTKFGTATLTVTPALTMSAVSATATSTTATFSWTTNLVAWGGISYGLNLGYGTTSPWVSTQSTSHSVSISGLTPSTTYYVSAFSFLPDSTSTSKALSFTTPAAAPTVTGVAVNCSPTSLSAGSSEVCASTVSGTGSYSSAVTWSTTAGSITSSGILTAPASGTSITVKAVSVQDPTKFALATLTITPKPTVSSVKVVCPVSTLVAGKSTTCSATINGTNNPTSAVTWSASGGSVSASGFLTTSTTATSVVVTATSVQDPTKSASLTIALTQSATINNINVSCPADTLPNLKSITCTATAVGTGSPSSAVTWSATAGANINSAGKLTAPATGAGDMILVTATSTQDPTKSGSTSVKIVENLAILNPTFLATPTTIVVSWDLTQWAYSGVSYDSGPGSPTLTTPDTHRSGKHASFTFTGLTPGTTYNATIFSSNRWGAVSQAGSVTTPLQ